jgi:hypothetical protein
MERLLVSSSDRAGIAANSTTSKRTAAFEATQQRNERAEGPRKWRRIANYGSPSDGL